MIIFLIIESDVFLIIIRRCFEYMLLKIGSFWLILWIMD